MGPHPELANSLLKIFPDGREAQLNSTLVIRASIPVPDRFFNDGRQTLILVTPDGNVFIRRSDDPNYFNPMSDEEARSYADQIISYLETQVVISEYQ